MCTRLSTAQTAQQKALAHIVADFQCSSQTHTHAHFVQFFDRLTKARTTTMHYTEPKPQSITMISAARGSSLRGKKVRAG